MEHLPAVQRFRGKLVGHKSQAVRHRTHVIAPDITLASFPTHPIALSPPLPHRSVSIAGVLQSPQDGLPKYKNVWEDLEKVFH